MEWGTNIHFPSRDRAGDATFPSQVPSPLDNTALTKLNAVQPDSGVLFSGLGRPVRPLASLLCFRDGVTWQIQTATSRGHQIGTALLVVYPENMLEANSEMWEDGPKFAWRNTMIALELPVSTMMELGMLVGRTFGDR